MRQGRLAAGQTVLIHGVAGGGMKVGHLPPYFLVRRVRTGGRPLTTTLCRRPAPFTRACAQAAVKGVYATEFFASMSPGQPRIGRLGEHALGIFRIGTELWLTYLTFAAALNFILNYNLSL